MKKTLVGPYEVELVLDSDEVSFDNPGDGTPAIVRYKGGTATYACAINEGEVDDGRNMIALPHACVQWLYSHNQDVEDIYTQARREQKGVTHE